MRFSLRTLLIAVTLIAIGLGVWFGYRRATMCEVRWLKLGSAESNALTAAPVIVVNDSQEYELTYFPRFCTPSSLNRRISSKSARTGFMVLNTSLHCFCETMEDAQNDLRLLQNADRPQPNTFLIRGRVEDRQHKPIAYATVDLQGPFQFVDHFEAFSDGTFTMLLTYGTLHPPAGSGCYLRIRALGDSTAKPQRWETPSFSLSPNQPEMEVILTVPISSPKPTSD